MFVGTQFEPQPIDDAPGDFVLHRDDVVRRSIDAIAPNNFAARHFKQLRVDAKAFADVNEPGRQNRVDIQLAADVTWIGGLSLIFRHDR